MNAQVSPARNDKSGRPRGRILVLVQNDSYPDDTRVRLEAHTLRDAGYQVSVICPTGTSRRWHENLAGVYVYRYPKPWDINGLVGYALEYAYSLTITFFLSLYVAVQHGFDIIHARTPPDMYVLIAVFYRLFGKRLVVDVNDPSPELYLAQQDGNGNRCVLAILYWFERWACRTADRLIAVSEAVRRIQIERCGLPADRYHLVRNVPSERFLEPVEPLPSLRDTGRIVIGYMGITGIQDRVDMMLRMLFELKNTLGRTDFLGVLVGSGAALDDLKRLAGELELNDHIHFAGYCVGDDLLRHVASFDIGIVPDPSNPYNDCCAMLKLMEYMAMSKPAVAFDLPENRITAGEAAIFVQNNDVLEFASQVARLMDDPDLRQRLGQLGQKRVRDHLVWEHQQQQLIDAYEQLLPGRDACTAARPARPKNVAAGAPTTDQERVMV